LSDWCDGAVNVESKQCTAAGSDLLMERSRQLSSEVTGHRALGLVTEIRQGLIFGSDDRISQIAEITRKFALPASLQIASCRTFRDLRLERSTIPGEVSLPSHFGILAQAIPISDRGIYRVKPDTIIVGELSG